VLEDRHRQHHAELPGERREPAQRRVLGDAGREREVPVVVILAEVRRFKELGQQDDPAPAGRGLAHQPLGLGDVGRAVIATAHLDRRDTQFAHGSSPARRRYRRSVLTALMISQSSSLAFRKRCGSAREK